MKFNIVETLLFIVFLSFFTFFVFIPSLFKQEQANLVISFLFVACFIFILFWIFYNFRKESNIKNDYRERIGKSVKNMSERKIEKTFSDQVETQDFLSEAGNRSYIKYILIAVILILIILAVNFYYPGWFSWSKLSDNLSWYKEVLYNFFSLK